MTLLWRVAQACRLLDKAWSCVPAALGLDPATWSAKRGTARDLCFTLEGTSVALITLAGVLRVSRASRVSSVQGCMLNAVQRKVAQ
jgi:hypothetical protein